MKKSIILIATLCMCVAILTACGGSGAGSRVSLSGIVGNAYRVIVTDESGAAVQGVKVQLCSDTMCLMEETDAEGVATFENQEAGTYTIHVYEVPEGYAEDKTEYDAPATYGDINITLRNVE